MGPTGNSYNFHLLQAQGDLDAVADLFVLPTKGCREACKIIPKQEKCRQGYLCSYNVDVNWRFRSRHHSIHGSESRLITMDRYKMLEKFSQINQLNELIRLY
jgi:hypothetical protein